MFKSMASILSPTMPSHEEGQPFLDPERSDPAVNSDALPDDHSIHLLPEARTFYGSGRLPPFVLNKRTQVTKSVVIPTRNGSRPKEEKETKVNIVAKVCLLETDFFPVNTFLDGWGDLSHRLCSIDLFHDSTSGHEKGMLTRASSLALG